MHSIVVIEVTLYKLVVAMKHEADEVLVEDALLQLDRARCEIEHFDLVETRLVVVAHSSLVILVQHDDLTALDVESESLQFLVLRLLGVDILQDLAHVRQLHHLDRLLLAITLQTQKVDGVDVVVTEVPIVNLLHAPRLLVLLVLRVVLNILHPSVHILAVLNIHH